MHEGLSRLVTVAVIAWLTIWIWAGYTDRADYPLAYAVGLPALMLGAYGVVRWVAAGFRTQQ